MKAFVIDVTHCNGCYCCQIACKDEHCGNDWSPYAKPQPDTGHFWGRMDEYVRGTIPKVKIAYAFVPCQHCENAPCIKACTAGAISRRDDGLVIIDPEKCTGCRDCLTQDACPYGAIYFNDSLNIAQKCTGCAHLIDRGWKEPRCADNCPHEAIKFGEEAELADLIAKAEILHPEYGLKPRVYYIGLPKRFIAGTVYDPVKKDIIKGATCTLTGDGGPYTTTTDGFGDFWFEGLKVATFSLKIEATGFVTRTINGINTEKDVNLGDMPLSR
jgi:Fe-S-cluster-containing dehydrogenase component